MLGFNRHFVRVWDLTHRCYKKEFLFKLARDRRRRRRWLVEFVLAGD